MKKPESKLIMMFNKQGKIIFVLFIALVIAMAYIAVDRYNEVKAQEQLDILQQGVQIGYQQAILQIMQQASTCQQVPLFADDQTMNLISVECLDQG